jgi:hypothetical protein
MAPATYDLPQAHILSIPSPEEHDLRLLRKEEHDLRLLHKALFPRRY